VLLQRREFNLVLHHAQVVTLQIVIVDMPWEFAADRGRDPRHAPAPRVPFCLVDGGVFPPLVSCPCRDSARRRLEFSGKSNTHRRLSWPAGFCDRSYIDAGRNCADAHGHAEQDAFLRSPHLFENTPNKDRHLSAELP
jgi:hypothetical protein